MKKMFSNIIRTLVDGTQNNHPLAGFNIADQFNPDLDRDTDVARNINAAFLILLSGPDHGLYSAVKAYLDALTAEISLGRISPWKKYGESFFRRGLIAFWIKRKKSFLSGPVDMSVSRRPIHRP
ncbi:MAG: hypothetical protein B6240_05315 [Desulfobacteraceae bacterium 4572_87]|nr:MAG: hypothetical protein B6240_05315 [Desulfobacteraceae bacterium 4572_87]